MKVVAFMRELVARGMSWEDAAAMAERFEEGIDEARLLQRSPAALRQAAYRERKRNGEHNNEHNAVCNTEHNAALRPEGAAPARVAGPQVVIPSLSSLPSEVQKEVGGGGGGVSAGEPADDWPGGKAADHATQLVALVASPWLDPQKSPELVTTRGRVAAWKRDGASWEHDVLPVVTGLCANRRSPVASWKFFDQAVARSIADNRRALEIPVASAFAQIRQTGPPRSFDEKSSAAWDYAAARIAEDG